MEEDLFLSLSPAVYTPDSDLAAGSQLNQLIWGRTGNDILIAYQPLGSQLGANQVDYLLADFEFPELVDPFPRFWSDTFVLGDWTRPYYAETRNFDLGLNSYGLLLDFDPSLDRIQLYGKSSDYTIVDLGSATILSYNSFIDLGFIKIPVPDVVAVIPVGNLSLDGSYFTYVGNSAPAPTNPSILQIGSAGFEISDAITADSKGNILLAGHTTSTFTHDSNIGSRDVWITKYDSNRDILWTKQFGSPDFDTIYSIATDPQDNIYVIGTTQGELGGPRKGINADAWFGKFDTDGNQLWLSRINSNGNGEVAGGYGIDIDASGSIYVSGVVDVPTPPGSLFPISTDNFLSKYDADGNQIWYSQSGSPGVLDFDDSYNLATDPDGNSYLVGFTTSSDYAGPLLGLYDGWISKHDSNGNLEWIQQVATTDYDWLWGVDTDTNGDVIVAGWTLGEFANGGGSLGSYDSIVAKYSADGQQQWLRQFGTAGDDTAFSLKIGSDNAIYIAGYTSGSFNGYAIEGLYDIYVAKYDSAGSQQWINQFGTPGVDRGYDLVVADDGSLYVTGVTDGSFGSLNSGSYDTFIAKLSQENGQILPFQSPAVDPITGLEEIAVQSPASSTLITDPVSNLLSTGTIGADSTPNSGASEVQSLLLGPVIQPFVDSTSTTAATGLNSTWDISFGTPTSPSPSPSPSPYGAELLSLLAGGPTFLS